MNYIENLKKSFDEKELLKITNLTLTGIVVALCGTLVTTATRDPILVDRSSRKTVIIEKVATDEEKISEVENFLREALSLRFDSKVKSSSELLSKELARAHEIEEGELKAKQVAQSVVVNGIQKTKDGFVVDADRIVSISKLRSAFSFPLKAQIEKTSRSEQNPYGLMLIRIEKLKEVPREN
jgi:hypothetical protein